MNPELIRELREIATTLAQQYDLGSHPDLTDAQRLRSIADQLEAAAPPQQFITLSRNLARRILDTHAGNLRTVFDRPERSEVDAIPIGNLLAVQAAAEYVLQMTGHLMWPEDIAEPAAPPDITATLRRLASELRERDDRGLPPGAAIPAALDALAEQLAPAFPLPTSPADPVATFAAASGVNLAHLRYWLDQCFPGGDHPAILQAANEWANLQPAGHPLPLHAALHDVGQMLLLGGSAAVGGEPLAQLLRRSQLLPETPESGKQEDSKTE